LVAAEEKPPSGAITAAPPAKTPSPDEDDAGGGYDVFTDPEIEELARKRAAAEEARLKTRKKEKKDLPKLTRKKKAIPEADAWKMVRLGLLVMLIGLPIWGLAHVLQGTYVILGSVEFPEYSPWIAANMESRGDAVNPATAEVPGTGEFWTVDELKIYLGIIAGRDLLGTAKAFLVISTILYFLQALAWGAGSFICLAVPNRLNMFGQLIASLVVGFFNAVIMLVFRFLPVVGLMGYVMIPFVTPEISMTEYNMDRLVPIIVMWSDAPYWESFLTIIFRLLFYLQPTILCSFIWSVGITIKEDTIVRNARGGAQLCLGTLFILIGFHLLSLCGATPVAVIVLRIFYGLWFAFSLMTIAQLASVIVKTRALLYEKIYPKNELE
jgi:hypothetical protein